MARRKLILTVVSLGALVVVVSLGITFSTDCIECIHTFEETDPGLARRIKEIPNSIQRNDKMADQDLKVIEQQSVSVEEKNPSPGEYVEKKVEVKKVRVKREMIDAPMQPCAEGFLRDSNGKCRPKFN